VLDPDDVEHRRTLRDVCKITHHHEEAYVGALAVATALRAACASPFDASLERVAATLPDSRVRDRVRELAAVDAGADLEAVAARFGNSGYVVESVPLALFVARDAATLGFEGVLERALRAGGDVDTIASIAGQIAGAVLTRPAIDRVLLDRVDEIAHVTAMASAVAECVERLRA
ncbi:MAG: ADP-ribosylglycohydrolase family protein, partial [Planctomycetes bacterium]|nr:ADP-ribosylglycohydrolase family protein [Planctomycetota bacterium]